MTCCYPPTQEMRLALVWAVWQNGLEVFVCVLALRKLCVLIGIDCGLDCGLPVALEARGGAVLGVAWPLLPARLPVH